MRDDWAASESQPQLHGTAADERPYPLAPADAETVVHDLQSFASAWIERTGGERPQAPREFNSADAPARLCGHVYGAGTCCTSFTAAERAEFTSLRARVLQLTYADKPKKDALDGMLEHMRMFRVQELIPAGGAGPSVRQEVVAVLLFSLKVQGYLRQVWLRVPSPGPVVPGSCVTAAWSRENIWFDQCFVKHVMSWKKCVVIHRLAFEMRGRDLCSMRVTGVVEIASKQRVVSAEDMEIAQLGKKAKRKRRPTAKEIADKKRRRLLGGRELAKKEVGLSEN